MRRKGAVGQGEIYLAAVVVADAVGVSLGFSLQVVEPRTVILRVARMVETGVLA